MLPLLLLWTGLAAANTLEWHERGAGKLELTENGQTVFVYNHGAERECCYLHPVRSPHGVTVTDDGPADHKHHRGIFWAWPIVEVAGEKADLWMRKGATQRFERIVSKQAGAQAALTTEHSWLVGDRKVVKETLRLAVHPTAHHARVIEIALTLEALRQPVKIAGAPERNKGYGGVSCRFAPREGTIVRSSDGAVPVDEDHGHHEWAELEATYAGKRAGLRITADKTNVQYPNPWCLRQYGFVGANFPGVDAYTLEPGKPVTLRYTVRVSDVSTTSQAQQNGKLFAQSAGAMQKLMKAWLAVADPRTGLLPERLPGDAQRGLKPGLPRKYTPHNSGADLYPYLILTAEMTDPEIYQNQMMEMLRNEMRYASAPDGLPTDLDLDTGKQGPPSLFGAAEYAKDGLLSVTELLGRTPWFDRMADVTVALMNRAAVETPYGKLPAIDAELNGDVLQVLARLIPMTNDPRYWQWARRIADAYVEEILPQCNDLPCMKWDFAKHTGDGRVQLRDHGNETVVGLTLLYALEKEAKTDRAPKYEQAVRRMLDRILASANPDGMLYDAIDAKTGKPVRERLSDNWGYVYGAVYTFYQMTGEVKYRDAVRRVLGNLGKYRKHNWENGSFDGIADSIESALYLVNREPTPVTWAWIDAEIQDLLARQRPTGLIEDWYGEGNFNRTVYLYALAKSQGCRPTHWKAEMELGAVKEGDGLRLWLNQNATVKFDWERHKRVLGLARNYVRLNEFPEWFTVEPGGLYRLQGPSGEIVRVGSEMIRGVALTAGEWQIRKGAIQ